VFNNFGQEYIRDNNIQGLLSGEIYLSSKLDPSFRIQTESLSNVSNFTIQDGELIDFEPLNSLSRFVKLSELKHVKFSKLTNKITIKDQVVNIPEMDIHSSAIDLKIKGYHKFNGTYQYRVNLLLSELLSNKADEKIHKYGTVSEDEAGKTRLFLILNGINGKTEVKYDKESVKTKIKEDIQKEKRELKTILNEEFGLFKNDTSLKSGKQEDSDSFKIQWEEEEKKKEEKKPGKKKKKKTKSDFIIKWEEDTLNK